MPSGRICLALAESHHAVEQFGLVGGGENGAFGDELVKDSAVGLVAAFEAEHHGAALYGELAAVVGHVLMSAYLAHIHRQFKLDYIAGLPCAAHCGVTVAVKHACACAVDLQRVGLLGSRSKGVKVGGNG